CKLRTEQQAPGEEDYLPNSGLCEKNHLGKLLGWFRYLLLLWPTGHKHERLPFGQVTAEEARPATPRSPIYQSAYVKCGRTRGMVVSNTCFEIWGAGHMREESPIGQALQR
ncbi:hypothetical protein HAX54_042262, partial [Datura stramonium]|nr:hypothetical protein [Datura stramonium]